MKFTRIVSLATGLSVLAMSLLPIKASALSTATMSLSGASNNNGAFAVTVYENTNSDTVTTVYLQLSFSQAVSSVNYDYSVGPFATATPSGAHVALGTVTGQNPVARVSFTLASPGSTTAAVASSSFLKHANDDSTVENFAITRGSASFTYAAPAPPANNGGMGGGTPASSGSNTPTSTPSSAPAAASNKTGSNANAPATKAVAGEQTQVVVTTATAATTAKQDSTKQLNSEKADSKINKSSKAWLWLLIALAVTAGFVAARLRQANAAKAKVVAAKPSAPKKSAKPVVKVAAAPAAVAKKSTTATKSKNAKGGKTQLAKKTTKKKTSRA
jgi:hypothetical protein